MAILIKLKLMQGDRSSVILMMEIRHSYKVKSHAYAGGKVARGRLRRGAHLSLTTRGLLSQSVGCATGVYGADYMSGRQGLRRTWSM